MDPSGIGMALGGSSCPVPCPSHCFHVSVCSDSPDRACREVREASKVLAGLAGRIQGLRSRKPSLLSYKSFSAMCAGN